MKQFHLHLVSDSTGETVGSVARAALAQFDDVEPIEHHWTLVRSNVQVQKVIEGLRKNPGVVMYTLVDKAMRDTLRAECYKMGVPYVPILGHVIRELSAYLGEEAHSMPGSQHSFGEEYFARVDAIDYALSHDDGQAHWELEEADVILVGVSRTSKSPTCIYLANRGYKAANVPFVDESLLPAELFDLKNPLVVGLTISQERLLQIRKSRLLSLNEEEDTNYVDRDKIKEEIDASRKLCRKKNWPIIDVSRRSVEETAALIIQYRHKQVEKRNEEKA